MKRVDIISKVVGRSDTGKPVGGGISIPMGNYALKSDFESLKSMFNDFLEGDDTDSVINRWKDLEAFLNGISEDNTLDSILKAYVTLSGNQTITGEKNFTGGLKVNGSPIYYDTEKKYWKLEGDLLVTGGVTMYGNDSNFVPSTIMDAILYDDSTLGINSSGQLYVKGSVGGATTLGSLANVGSWADSVAPQDRIMYQAANSSQWVAKNLSDLAVGGVTGNYLPLSGGTINGSGDYLYVPLYINALNNQISGITFKTNGAERGHVGYSSGLGIRLHSSTAAGIAVSDSDEPIFYTADGAIKNTLWHAGNDGSGSGLDADLLDGKHLRDIIRYEGRNDNGNDAASAQTITYWGEGNWGHGYTYGTSLNIQGADSWNHRLDFRTDGVLDYYQGINTGAMTHIGTIAFTSSNVASATKLQTARTIWGQYFDGTGDIGNKSGSDASSIHIVDNRNDGVGGYQAIRFYYNTDNQATIHYFHNNFNGLAWTTKNLNIEADYITLGSWNNPAMIVNRNTGNVGIGTTNPRENLEVNNYALIGGNVLLGNGAIGLNRNTYVGGRYDTQFQGWQIDIGGNTLNFFTEGSLGSGNKVKFDASGNILATGGVTMYSDARKKTILNYVELSLQQVANAPLIEHYYNSDQNKTTHVGSIAQYWAEMNDWFCKKDSEGFYTMEIQNAALASAISVARELVKFETETDRRIRLLEEENKRLKEEVEQLKWNIA